MFQELGQAHGFEVDFDRTGEAFNSVQNLQNYAIVVFSNTSGNEILSRPQQESFEAYIKAGGNFLGIHAATDTYRTGWDWYRDLVGGSVRENPNHTTQNHPGIMDVIGPEHPSTENVPDPWSRNEEWYYWKGGGGYLFEGNIDVLQVRATGNEDYDEARPISWYKEFDGGKSFYTAMGHDISAYAEEHLRNHILGAINWLISEDDDDTDPTDPGEEEFLPPVISEIDDQSGTINNPIGPINFTVNDEDTDPNDLELSATSDNQELIPDENIVLAGTGIERSITINPTEGETGTANVTIVVSDGVNEISTSFLVEVENITSVANESFKKLVRIFPNPASDNMYLHLPEGIFQVFLKNIKGYVMLEEKLLIDQTSSTNLSLSGIPSGVYILKITSENANISRKIIVK
jgi:type 1 glutamine amidotransferase